MKCFLQSGQIVGGHQSVLSLSQPQMFARLLGLLPASGAFSFDTITIMLPDYHHQTVSQAMKKLYVENDSSEILSILGFRDENNCASSAQESQQLIEHNFILDTLTPRKETEEMVTKESGSIKGKVACDICGQFVSKLKEHLLRKHPENLDSKEATLYQCNMCHYSTRIKST